MEVKHELYSLRGCGNYHGKLVTRLIGGFEIFGLLVKTPEEVDAIIDSAEKSIEISIERGKSITVVNNGSINCINDKNV